MPERGTVIAFSSYIGFGRSDEATNYMSNSSGYDPQTSNMLFRVSGLRSHKLVTGAASQSRACMCTPHVREYGAMI